MLTKHAQEVFGQDCWDYIKDELTPIDVTPVAKWIFKSRVNDFREQDSLPSVRPPWDLMWAEFSTPRKIIDEKGGSITPFPNSNRVGCYAITEECPDPGLPHPHISKMRHMNGPAYNNPDPGLLAPQNGRWAVTWFMYLDHESHSVHVGEMCDFLDENGCIIFPERGKYRSMIPSESTLHDIRKGSATKKIFADWMATTIHPFLMAMSLAHANNVEMYEDHVPDPVQKKRRKSGKNPGKTFKCLDIDPMKKQSRRESEEGESDVERALHICRGHFKTYTEENPLFGQHTGTYWWPMHVRGSEDAGEVEKSYSVNNPSQ